MYLNTTHLKYHRLYNKFMDVNWKIDKFYLLFQSVRTFHLPGSLAMPDMFMLLIAFGYRIGVTMGNKMAFFHHLKVTKRPESWKIRCQPERRPTIEGHLIA